MSAPWHVRPDNTRESWCFLLLRTASNDDATRITGWKWGVGNPAQLVYTDEMNNEAQRNEDDVIAALWSCLDEHRYEQRFLHTPTRKTVALLRRNLLASPAVQEPSLRGLFNIPLGELIDEYFDDSGFLSQPSDWLIEPTLYSGRELESEEDVIKLFWQVRKSVEPLIPAEELEGVPL